MMKALIFDCDGVIADTEPLHMAAFQRVLAEIGVVLTPEEYYREYLAYDDRGCFERVFDDFRVDRSQHQIADLMKLKASYLGPVMREGLKVFPGIVEFVTLAAAKYPLAIASGALRNEVRLVLDCAGIRDKFLTIVAAEDVVKGKPAPDPFLEARSRLSAMIEQEIQPMECLVIEDSIHGVNSARAAEMKCLAITNSYPASHLMGADLVVPTLEGVDLQTIESLFT